MTSNVVLIGSQAREHAIAMAVASSPSFCHQGGTLSCCATTENPAIMALCRQTHGTYGIGDIVCRQHVLEFCRYARADVVIIGPEAPLEAGIADILRENDMAVFGPDADLAKIETSKSFARDFVQHVDPTVCPAYWKVTDMHEAEALLDRLGPRFVIKADGLAGGKGVKVATDHLHSKEEALAWCGQLFSASPKPIIIEEKLYGEEFSLMTVTDGTSFIHLDAVQDHKRAFDGDCGPNTGGMGSYSCSGGSLPFLADADIATARRLNERVVAELSRLCNRPYRGVLYGGFMAVSDGIKLIEYNARFGDPEVMNLLATLQSDALELFTAAANGNLSSYRASIADTSSVCVYAVPMGYPGQTSPHEAFTLPPVGPEVRYHMGSVDQDPDGTLRTAGSRTIGFVGCGATLEQARRKVVGCLDHMQGPLRWRTDIASSEAIAKKITRMEHLRRPVRIGVMGSTRGTDLRSLLEMIANGSLRATIAAVFSDRPDAPILTLATEHGIPVSAGGIGMPKAALERLALQTFTNAGVDLILLIGYMRILSPSFCTKWWGRLYNVHPSLLPEFAGAMDKDVHLQAIERMQRTGNCITGCTVHLVSPDVDAGTIILQKHCTISAEDTPDTLKEKVQRLEAVALAETIALFSKSGGRDMTWEN